MKLYYRTSAAGGNYTQVAHYAEDGKPAASSFPGHITEAQALRLLASFRRQVANPQTRTDRPQAVRDED